MSSESSNPPPRGARLALTRGARLDRKRGALRRLAGDSTGAAAMEFALVLLPFVLLLVGTMEVGRYFFTAQSVRTVVANAARMAMLDGNLASSNTIPAGTGTNCSDSYTVSTTERDTVNANTPFLDNSLLKICINNTSGTGARTVLVKAAYQFNSIIPYLPATITITDQTTLTFIRS